MDGTGPLHYGGGPLSVLTFRGKTKMAPFWRIAGSIALMAAAAGQARAEPWPDAACRVGIPVLERPETLARTRQKIADKAPLTIVAFGSSSTEGVGASTPAAAYPARLEALLRDRAGVDARVINHGVGGETILDMRARLNRDVLRVRPDLVIWQVGSNAAMRAMDPELFTDMLERETWRLRRDGADVILMDPQVAPEVDARPGAAAIIAGVHAVAGREKIALMPRHRIMEAWAASPAFPGRFVDPDGLHMNDLGYHCLAVLLAEGLTGAPLPELRR